MSTDEVRAAYDAQPWPPHGGLAGPLLPEHWVNSAARVPALRPGSRILVAGCGAGGEAAAFAQRYPGADVVGVDLSPRSVALAQANHPGLRFEIADLADADLVGSYGRFDFISCHSVIDYVPDAGAALANLNAALADDGVLYAGMNTAFHTGGRIRDAFGRMGLPAHGWTEGAATRAGLRIVHGLLGDAVGIRDLPLQSAGLLCADVFPAFSHGRTLREWTALAEDAGLRLAGSIASLWALQAVGDRDLPLLYGEDRAGLAHLVEDLRRSPVLQVLFTRSPVPTPPWRDASALMRWSATVHPHLGRERFPPLAGDWMVARSLSLTTAGLHEVKIGLSAWMLELFRRCDGRAPLAEVRAGMPVEVHDDHVAASLFRFWHAGLVDLYPLHSETEAGV